MSSFVARFSLLGFVACHAAEGLVSVAEPAPDTAGWDSEETRDTYEQNRVFALEGPASIAIPYVSAGADAESPPSATFELSATGVLGVPDALTATVVGDFALALDLSAMTDGEVRTGTVSFTGSTADPLLASGTLTIEGGDQPVVIALGAVVGDPDIPPATWTSDAWGACTTVGLPSAPFPYGSASYTDDSVKICVPTGLSDRGNIGIIHHFHGHNATISEVDAYQQLHAQAALSGRDAVFILPQGPVEASDGDFGRLDTASGLATLVRDVIAVLYRDGFVTQPVIGSVVLTSHSGGYGGTANSIDVGGLPIAAVHLFDSVYGYESTFANYAEAGGVLRSSYTSGGGTDDENVALAATLRSAGLDVRSNFGDDTLRASPVTIGLVDSAHGDCLSDERFYGRWLAASGLPRRPNAAPDLLATEASGANSIVRWRDDEGFAAVIQGSDDGESWSDLARTEGATATVTAHAYLRVLADEPDAESSDVYGTAGSDWLVVDGFDRIFGGSWDLPSHDFAARVGQTLAFSAVSNESVAEGIVDLGAYDNVIWLLGDESTADRTFDDRERTAIEGFLAGGGRLVVSGSEVGYATDGWLTTELHADFASDDAGTDTVEGWTLGVTYPEDFPDVLTGDATLWRYASGGSAAVSWEGQIVVVGFALETLDDSDLAEAVGELEGELR